MSVSNGGSEVAAWLPQDSLRRLCPESLADNWLGCRLPMGWARLRGGENIDVHPPRKAEVGRRLARTALGKVYGLPATWQNPRISAARQECGALRLSLKHAQGLHTVDRCPPVGFELAGEDGAYRPARAEIRGREIILTHPDVPHPQKARYGWAVMILPNAVNARELPLAPWALRH